MRGRRRRVACPRRRRESEVETRDEWVIARNVPEQKEQRGDADSEKTSLHDADSGAGAIRVRWARRRRRGDVRAEEAATLLIRPPRIVPIPPAHPQRVLGGCAPVVNGPSSAMQGTRGARSLSSAARRRTTARKIPLRKPRSSKSSSASIASATPEHAFRSNASRTGLSSPSAHKDGAIIVIRPAAGRPSSRSSSVATSKRHRGHTPGECRPTSRDFASASTCFAVTP